jgi:hypothetical protein
VPSSEAVQARKVLNIRADAIQAIVADGDDKPALAPEPLMLFMTRIFCLGVSSPARLRQRHRLMNGAVQFFLALRLSALPAVLVTHDRTTVVGR